MLNYIIKSENSQNQNNICEIKKIITVNKLENNQKVNENLKDDVIKPQIKSKVGIFNFMIEKKYKNNVLKNSKIINEKHELKESAKPLENDKIDQETEAKDVTEKTEIKTTESSISETKELLVNLDPNLHMDLTNGNINDSNNKDNLISKLKQKSKFSNFKRLGLNRNQLENNNNSKALTASKNINLNQNLNNKNINNSNNQGHSACRNQAKREYHNNNQAQKNICCDKIFYEYLKSITKYANQKYFLFVFKFIIIFRECINTYKNIELENSILVLKENIPLEIKEFTQYYDAEQAPELCNEFISEYLQSCDYFGLDKNEITEVIDIIQHFCYWMYENNYTSSRLSLLNIN